MLIESLADSNKKVYVLGAKKWLFASQKAINRSVKDCLLPSKRLLFIKRKVIFFQRKSKTDIFRSYSSIFPCTILGAFF